MTPTSVNTAVFQTVTVLEYVCASSCSVLQFYLLGTTFFCVACGGMGIFSVAKPMMGEVFSSTLPTLVTAAFASQYVQMLAAGNLGGRIGWAGNDLAGVHALVEE